MDSFQQTCDIERLGEADLLPYMEAVWPNCAYYTTKHHKWVQKFLGDCLVSRDGDAKYIEIKTEQQYTGNLFIETWSNKSRDTLGWFHACHADWLWYYFLDDRKLYVIPLPTLQKWGHQPTKAPRIECFKEVPQRKYDQRNDTWGRLVPIHIVLKEIEGCKGPIDPVAAL